MTVLKDGRLVGTREVAGTTPDDLIRMMVGRSVELARSVGPRTLGAVVLEAVAVAAPPLVRSVSLQVRAGEIVCLAGLIGSGRSEFCEAVFGARRRSGGRVRLAGRDLAPRGPWDGMAAGVGMVPEDRKDRRALSRHERDRQHHRDRRAQARLRHRRGAGAGGCGGAALRGRVAHRDAEHGRRWWATSPAATSRRCCWRSGWRPSRSF